MFSGEFRNKIDEKGRLLVPSRLRSEFGSESLYITKGIEGNHLMLLTANYFENQFIPAIYSSSKAIFNAKARILARAYIGSSQRVEFDTQGRINIPAASRQIAELSLKGEVLILGVGESVELWNPAVFEKENAIYSPQQLAEIAESLGQEERG